MIPDFLKTAMGYAPSSQPEPNKMNFSSGGPGAMSLMPPQINPNQSPATDPNRAVPYDAPKVLREADPSYVAPGPMSPVEPAAGVDWKNIALGAAAGLASSMGSKEEPQQQRAPAPTGGSFFRPPEGRMSDGNMSGYGIGGAPKGILAQNKQL
jgi:hypothetical protein